MSPFQKFDDEDEYTHLILFAIGGAFLLVAFVGFIGKFAQATWWAIIPGFILIAIGLAQFYQLREQERMLLSTLKAYEGDQVPLATIAQELNMRPQNFRQAVIKLRANGLCQIRFEGENLWIDQVATLALPHRGHRKKMIVSASKPSYNHPAPKASLILCPSCGATQPADANFCEFCGTKL